MPNRIVDVHSITAAPAGWRRLTDDKPVACFALVTTTSAEHPGQLNEKVILPIVDADLVIDLLGREVDMATDEAAFLGPIAD